MAISVAEVLDEIAGDDPGDAYDTLHGVLEHHLGESRRQATSAETVRSALEVVAAGGVDDGSLPQLMVRSTELGCVSSSMPFDRDDEIALELAIGAAAPLSIDLACTLAAGRAGEADDPRTPAAAAALAAAWWAALVRRPARSAVRRDRRRHYRDAGWPAVTAWAGCGSIMTVGNYLSREVTVCNRACQASATAQRPNRCPLLIK